MWHRASLTQQWTVSACNNKVIGLHENYKRIFAVLFLPLECSFLPFLFCCYHRMSAQIYCHCCHLANEYHEMQQALNLLWVYGASSLKSDSSKEVLRLAKCSWNINVTVRFVFFFPNWSVPFRIVLCFIQNLRMLGNKIGFLTNFQK